MKLSKFLTVGALALVTQLPVSAQNSVVQTEAPGSMAIVNSIKAVLANQYEKGYITERALLNVNFLPIRQFKKAKRNENNGLILDPKGQITFIDAEEANFTDTNYLVRNDGVCKMELAFDDKGKIPYFGKDELLADITALQNEAQREIARQFIAIHEQYHCEFSNLIDPIRVKGKDAEFNKKLNFYLKDIYHFSWQDKQVGSFENLLNENFADTAAKMVLIQNYGENNKDLQYVLKAIYAQRHDAYFQYNIDTHFTHFSLQELDNPERIEQVKKATTPKDFINLALEVANEGTQKVIAHKKGFNIKIFSDVNLETAIMYQVSKGLWGKNNPKNDRGSPYGFGIPRGFAYEMAQKVMKDIDLKTVPFPLYENKNDQYYGFTLMAVQEKMQTRSMTKEVEKYNKTLGEFKTYIDETYKDKLVAFDIPVFRVEMMGKIKEIRKRFIEETQEHSSNAVKPDIKI